MKCWIVGETTIFPNELGAVNGKHVVNKLPKNGDSDYINYKGSYSVIFMAITDPHYECLYSDVGTNDRINAGGVWNKCKISAVFEDQTIPGQRGLPVGNENEPFCFSGR